MFRDKFQKGYLSILYSCGASPLELWNTHVENGYIRRVTDNDINSLALEIAGTNVSTTYIYTPKDRKTVLGIELGFLIMVIKNMKKYFTFEITSATKIRPFSISMPMGLSGGWNQIQFNLADFCKRAYGSNYIETTRMQIHANCRIRRVYFSDRLYLESELPDEYRISGFIRKCVREEDKKRQEKEDSKTRLSRTSNQSQKSPASQDEEKPLSTIVSEVSKSLDAPAEHTKLQIDIPTAEYEEGADNLSIDQESVSPDYVMEQRNFSDLSIENNLEEQYTSPVF